MFFAVVNYGLRRVPAVQLLGKHGNGNPLVRPHLSGKIRLAVARNRVNGIYSRVNLRSGRIIQIGAVIVIERFPLSYKHQLILHAQLAHGRCLAVGSSRHGNQRVQIVAVAHGVARVKAHVHGKHTLVDSHAVSNGMLVGGNAHARGRSAVVVKIVFVQRIPLQIAVGVRFKRNFYRVIPAAVENNLVAAHRSVPA